MVNVTEATMGVVTEEIQTPKNGPLFGNMEVKVGTDIADQGVVEEASQQREENTGIPSPAEFYEQLKRMPSAERLLRAKEYLNGKLADETLSSEQRQGVEILLGQSDEFLSTFIDGQIESRFAELSTQTALVPYVEQEAHDLVQAGVITVDQARVACENTVKLLEDGKGPKNKEGIKEILLFGSVGWFEKMFMAVTNAIKGQ